ncbi:MULTISPECIES: acetate/propionate family kinase [Dictyoglomus]|uniref:Acetate kinase n=1 Tax=Dictyoglomus turgidum (strain DSM 6724 / Z-1310) TaxID=515635 RepID=ACKA_DICTD|nr:MULTISPECIES: acetate kinase [Dictyoglomus]B8E191.1 RecName: Full=Acetate kinase; AltName: Full=Acetokinase [Dictyoglomus turgidum DSM 6724]ACK42219.1 acetate kinase [Dictyoglomus turgidum DSM 6724]HBU32449.1 acetate kinase [Dictyoglomus sp.]
MKVLVLNCGSSSVKYQVFDMKNESVLAKGLAERIGLEGSRIVYQRGSEAKKVFEIPLPTHKKAIEEIFKLLVDKNNGVLQSLNEIDAVGHRVVHGGDKFVESVLVNDEVYSIFKGILDLAPLHNPYNLQGVDACSELMPGVPQVLVFDTSFHQTMPEEAYIYALPYEWYEKYKIRRYGFHGTSHYYVSRRVAELIGRPVEELKIISCHLGNGASITAIKNGKSIDTSMGYTPLEGLVMGTRCGDIDPAIPILLMEKENLTPKQMDEILNKKSGILGISGVSSDFRDVGEAAEKGNKRAELALKVFAYRVKKYIGAYYAILGGLDVLVFTAGVGERGPLERSLICSGLEHLGIKLDPEKNKVKGEELRISAPDSKVEVWVIPTNEELMIARETVRVVGEKIIKKVI